MGHDQSFEPLAMLAFAAACTSRVRLCSATFIAPVRNPIEFAKSMATIDQLSVGRLTVGISLGDMRSLYDASGVPIGQRSARIEELVEIMRRFWTQDSVTFESRFFTIRDMGMEPKPVQRPHPPIWFGGHSAPALERASRLGSGWIGAGGRSIEEFGRSAAELRRLVAGRDFTIGKKLYMAVGRDRDTAFAGLRDWFRVHWGADDGGTFASRVGVYGTVADVVARALEAWRLGADFLIFNPVHDEREHLEVIAREILPALREATRGGRRSA